MQLVQDAVHLRGGVRQDDIETLDAEPLEGVADGAFMFLVPHRNDGVSECGASGVWKLVVISHAFCPLLSCSPGDSATR